MAVRSVPPNCLQITEFLNFCGSFVSPNPLRSRFAIAISFREMATPSHLQTGPDAGPSGHRRRVPTVPAAAERILVVEARDLDTDERTVVTFEVEMPADESGQRAQLAAAVTRLHPGTRMRSFGDGAASFLDSQRLVVAHYGGAGGQLLHDRSAEPVEQVEQQPLFAA